MTATLRIPTSAGARSCVSLPRQTSTRCWAGPSHVYMPSPSAGGGSGARARPRPQFCHPGGGARRAPARSPAPGHRSRPQFSDHTHDARDPRLMAVATEGSDCTVAERDGDLHVEVDAVVQAIALGRTPLGASGNNQQRGDREGATADRRDTRRPLRHEPGGICLGLDSEPSYSSTPYPERPANRSVRQLAM